MAMGVPGCPELAAWTASIDSVRIVLMQVASSGCFSDLIDGFGATVVVMAFVPRSCLGPDSGRHVPVVIPESDGRIAQPMLVAQDTQRRRAEHQVFRSARGKGDPARAQDAETVGMAEEQAPAA